LIDTSIIDKIVLESGVGPSDSVLEIGTGDGRLTERLLKIGCNVVSYEIDPALYLQARHRLQTSDKLRILLGNGFNDRSPYDVLVSSLPYCASRKFVEWFVRAPIPRAVIVLQKDFVNKLMAPVGCKKYGPYSVMGQTCFDMEELFLIYPDSFVPPPKVVSSVLSMKRRRSILDPRIVPRLKFIFSYRGRTVSRLINDMRRRGTLPYDYGQDLSLTKKRIEELEPVRILELAADMV